MNSDLAQRTLEPLRAAELRHHIWHDPHRQASSLSDVILGGQDGLVNVLGVILGVAAATHDPRLVLVAGPSATFAESVSMGPRRIPPRWPTRTTTRRSAPASCATSPAFHVWRGRRPRYLPAQGHLRREARAHHRHHHRGSGDVGGGDDE